MAAVVGRPSERHGEEVVAFVSLAAGAEITGEDLVDWAREHIGGYKYPREVHLVDAIPLTPVGKIDRKAVRARVARRRQSTSRSAEPSDSRSPGSRRQRTTRLPLTRVPLVESRSRRTQCPSRKLSRACRRETDGWPTTTSQRVVAAHQQLVAAAGPVERQQRRRRRRGGAVKRPRHGASATSTRSQRADSARRGRRKRQVADEPGRVHHL